MKYYSEILKKVFDDADECKAAEQEILDARQKAKEEKEKLLSERKERADEVEEARKKMVEAQKNFEDVLMKFINDYGTYHYSTSDIEDFPRLLSSFWF